MSAPAGPLVAVVPLKALPQSKRRLGHDLDPAQRRELTAWMLERVLAACAAARAVSRVLVAAGDPASLALARGLGADAELTPQDGLVAALGAADRALGDAAGSMVVTADLPLATGTALDQVAAAGTGAPAVVVAASLDGGTSVLLRRPHAVVPTAFGPGSARRHEALAAQAGVAFRRLDIPALALDVDDAEDLRRASARLPELERWLSGRGLGRRPEAS